MWSGNTLFYTLPRVQPIFVSDMLSMPSNSSGNGTVLTMPMGGGGNMTAMADLMSGMSASQLNALMSAMGNATDNLAVKTALLRMLVKFTTEESLAAPRFVLCSPLIVL